MWGGGVLFWRAAGAALAVAVTPNRMASLCLPPFSIPFPPFALLPTETNEAAVAKGNCTLDPVRQQRGSSDREDEKA